jgi:FKBP-type peptidyl-prolyl cis-trans isomerase SlyD
LQINFKKDKSMVIAKDSVVSITYELKLPKKNNEIVETVNTNNPLEFLLGYGNLLPKFESNLTGLNIGDKFEFILKSDEAYGLISAEAIVELPKTVFMVDGQINEEILVLDNVIPMMDQGGNRFNGRVVELTNDNVKMDFNHPLAGEDLHFKGEVVGIREATEEELNHGHIHAGGGCGSGDCGCGSSCDCEDEASMSAGGGCGCGSGCGCN